MITRKHIPNALSWLRVLLILPILLTWYMAPQTMHYAILLGCFILASVSDFLDGYLARKWQLQTAFGAMLDQISDKLIVGVMLILLVADNAIAPYAPIIIILREIYVSGLREYAGTQRISMPVSRLGKIKTATQMLAILCLLASRALSFPLSLSDSEMFLLYMGGNGFLWLSALLGVVSALQYSRVLRS